MGDRDDQLLVFDTQTGAVTVDVRVSAVVTADQFKAVAAQEIKHAEPSFDGKFLAVLVRDGTPADTVLLDVTRSTTFNVSEAPPF